MSGWLDGRNRISRSAGITTTFGTVWQPLSNAVVNKPIEISDGARLPTVGDNLVGTGTSGIGLCFWVVDISEPVADEDWKGGG